MAASKTPAPSRAKRPTKRPTKTRGGGAKAEGLAALAEQLASRIIKPLGLVVLSRERIQETLDEAAERGRLTRTDADHLVAELVRLGREQTDELLSDLERLLGQGRQRIDTATKRARSYEAVDRIVRGADRARRSVGAGPSFPISGYDDLTAAQVQRQLAGLSSAELRQLRDYERRHANRKSVLAAIEKALS
jgi:polyhydroxyalkanoate synthesis regulator phasin